MGIIAVIIAATVFLSLFYFFLIYPVQALIHCGRNGELASHHKTYWILALLCIWPIAALFYNAKYKSRVSLWRPAILTLMLALSGGAGLYYLKETLLSTSSEFFAQVNFKKAGVDLQPDEVQYLERSSLELQTNLRKISLANLRAKEVEIELTDLLMTYLQDKSMSSQEFKDWKKYYDLRETLDAKKIKDIVRQEKSKAQQQSHRDLGAQKSDSNGTPQDNVSQSPLASAAPTASQNVLRVDDTNRIESIKRRFNDPKKMARQYIPTPKESLAHKLIKKYQNKKEFRKAEMLYLKSIQKFSASPSLRNAYAVFLIRQDRSLKARKVIDKTRELFPEDIESSLLKENLALIVAAKGSKQIQAAKANLDLELKLVNSIKTERLAH